jgi:hypothetical protein
MSNDNSAAHWCKTVVEAVVPPKVIPPPPRPPAGMNASIVPPLQSKQASQPPGFTSNQYPNLYQQFQYYNQPSVSSAMSAMGMPMVSMTPE